MIEAGKLLAAKPELSLIGDAARAQNDTHQAGLALLQQSRALHLFDVMDAKQAEAAACIADLDMKAAVYVTCAKLFLSCCSAAPRKLAAKPCGDVLRATAQLCASTASQAASAAQVGKLEAAVEAVAKLTWRADVAAASVLLETESLLEDALGELKEAMEEVAGPSAVGGMGGEGSEEEEEEEEDACELLQHGPLTTAACQLLSLAVGLTVAGRACLTGGTDGRRAADLVNGDGMNGDAVKRDAVNRDAVNTNAVSEDAVNRDAVNRDAVNGALDQMAATLMTCAFAATAQADALVSSLAHENDAAGAGSHAGSLGKILIKMRSTVEQLEGLLTLPGSVDGSSDAGGLRKRSSGVGAELEEVVARCVAAAHEAEVGAPVGAASGMKDVVGQLAGALQQAGLT
jgi:hypothetical protein